MAAILSLRARLILLGMLLLAALGMATTAPAQQPSGRIALVIGDGAYASGALSTAANDAGLVAQTLTAAGFDVTGARDLDGDSLRRAFREFIDKANAAGPQGIAFIYVAGYAIQFDGENYLVPVDAALARDTDIPIQAVRVGDFMHALAAVPLQARVVVLDGAYADPAVPASDHIAPGLALVDPDPGTLVAFNTAPGAVAPSPTETYGPYGQALAEMMREGGVPVDDVFDRVRLRVNTVTAGAAIPWDASKLTGSFVFLDRAPDAPATASAQQSLAVMSKRPVREFPVDEAYSVAVARDTFPAYQDFLAAYPRSGYARRVRALLAVRREAITWRRTVSRNSSAAYWTYLQRYPRGPHVYDCRRQLTLLAAPLEPPPAFAPIDYDVPPPPEDEITIVDAPRAVFVEPDDPPPPPPPLYVLPPEPDDFVVLPPPPPPIGPGFLPIPVPIPIPYARPIAQPGIIVPPRGFQGQYAQPQPFMTAPNGRLVAQPAPAGAAPPILRPTTQPAPPAPASVPSAIPLRPTAPASPAPAGGPGGNARPLPATGAAPAAPAVVPPAVPAAPARVGAPTRPQPPATPGGGPAANVHALPTPPAVGRPPAPAAAPVVNPPAGVAPALRPGVTPAPAPLGAPGQKGRVAPASPANALPPAPAVTAPAPAAGGGRKTPPLVPENRPAVVPAQGAAPNGAVAPRPGGVVRPTIQEGAPPPVAPARPPQTGGRPAPGEPPAKQPQPPQQPVQQQRQPDQLRLQQQQQQMQRQQEQQRAQQQQQQLQRQQEQQRAQQQQQQMQRQQEQQRAQQQQQQMQRQQEQQRAQQQQQQIQRQQEQQRAQQQQQHPPRPDCGHPGQPACH